MDNYEEAPGAGVKLWILFENKESDSRIAVRSMFDMPLLLFAATAATANIPGTANLPSYAIESPVTGVWETCWDWALEVKTYPGLASYS